VGDYVTFEVNSDDHTWSYTNFTSPETKSGVYSVSADGTYLATAEGTTETFSILELPNVALVCPVNYGSGRMIMASTLKGDFAFTDLVGVYNYVDFQLGYWGTSEVKADSTVTFTLYEVATPEYTFVTRESDVLVSYSEGIITSAAWPGSRIMISPSGVMVIDNGPGLGIGFGVKRPASTVFEEGTFNCMDELSGVVGILTTEAPNLESWNFGGTVGGGVLTDIGSGVYRYQETVNTGADYPCVCLQLPGAVYVGVQNIGALPSDTDGFIGVKLH
jgi:hypothetical protein